MIVRRLAILAVIYAAIVITLVLVGGRYRQQLFDSLWMKTTGGGECEIFRGEGTLGGGRYLSMAEHVVEYAKIDQPERVVFARLADGTVSAVRPDNETRWASRNFPTLDEALATVPRVDAERLTHAWRKPKLLGQSGGPTMLLVLATAIMFVVAVKIIRGGKGRKLPVENTEDSEPASAAE